MSVTTDNFGSNKEYYVFKNQFEKTLSSEIHIDKETGLPIKQIGFSGEKIFYPGTDVLKEIRDTMQEYKYKFDIVTEEDVTVPDLSNYKVEYIKEDN